MCKGEDLSHILRKSSTQIYAICVIYALIKPFGVKLYSILHCFSRNLRSWQTNLRDRRSHWSRQISTLTARKMWKDENSMEGRRRRLPAVCTPPSPVPLPVANIPLPWVLNTGCLYFSQLHLIKINYENAFILQTLFFQIANCIFANISMPCVDHVLIKVKVYFWI